jgi:hypothetical protein
MSDSEITKLTREIGLPKSRCSYLRSLAIFINKHGIEYCLTSNTDEFIKLFANSVDSASYKVAQCAALYARGYHCGIIPIDSGMCEMLAPIMPKPFLHSGIGHEMVRKRLEEFAQNNSRFLLEQARSHEWLSVTQSTPTWWLHLLLIYYKRLYWNQSKSGIFPRHGSYVRDNQQNLELLPDLKRYPFIIIEGADGVGKTTLSNELASHGYVRKHCSFNQDCPSLFEMYVSLIQDVDQPTVFDRFFFSEIVYGEILRNSCRISKENIERLCMMLRDRGFVVFFVTSSVETILARRSDVNSRNLQKIMDGYRKLFEQVSPKLECYWLDSSTLVPHFFTSYFNTLWS